MENVQEIVPTWLRLNPTYIKVNFFQLYIWDTKCNRQKYREKYERRGKYRGQERMEEKETKKKD